MTATTPLSNSIVAAEASSMLRTPSGGMRPVIPAAYTRRAGPKRRARSKTCVVCSTA